MFPLPVANGKNRPTTLASTQFGGSGIVIFFFVVNNIVSYNKCVFATRDPTGAVSVVLCVVCFSGGYLLLVCWMLSLLLCVSLGRQSCSC